MSNSDKKLVFMWVAFYDNGQCLPQYDLESGKQNLFKDIDQSKLVKFGWFPFSVELAQKVSCAVVRSNLPYFILKLHANQRLIALRREFQHFYSYSKCLKCGFKWQWIPHPNRPDGSIGDAGLPRYGSPQYYYSVVQTNDKPAFEVICPKCGAKNDLKCLDCDAWWNKIDNKWTLQCPKCKKIREKQTESCSGHSIENIYLLGWQETKEGKNVKHIMFINEDGTFELSDNFNFR